MALTTNISNCVNWEELNNDANYPKTESIYFVTLVTELGQITAKNYGEFYARIRVYSLVSGGYNVTLEDVTRRIGLSTNVSDIPTTKFLKRMEQLATQYESATANEIKAVYYSALVEAEKETVNA
jgi:hypothetical protein